MNQELQNQYAQFVKDKAKDPKKIRDSICTLHKCDVIHAGMGISGEAGEIIDTVKKYAIYDQPLNVENLKEELGDLFFYMELLRQNLGITWEDIINSNMAKLNARYPQGYTDSNAQLRLDKLT